MSSTSKTQDNLDKLTRVEAIAMLKKIRDNFAEDDINGKFPSAKAGISPVAKEWLEIDSRCLPHIKKRLEAWAKSDKEINRSQQ